MGADGAGPAAVLAGRRRRRSPKAVALQLSAMALSFILIALLVVTSSRAAFVAQSDNVANSVSTPSILLSDNDTTAMFSVPALVPGQFENRCIDVTYAGTADPSQVSLFKAGDPTGTLAPYLDLRIEYAPDTTDAFGSCSTFPTVGTLVYNGTLADFAATRTTHLNSLTTWDPPSGTQTMTFRFRISVQDNTAAANKTTTFGFTWETRTS
jgi:hypothetical protein